MMISLRQRRRLRVTELLNVQKSRRLTTLTHQLLQLHITIRVHLPVILMMMVLLSHHLMQKSTIRWRT